MTTDDAGSLPPPLQPDSGDDVGGQDLERVETDDGVVLIRLPSGVELEWRQQP